MGHRATRRDRWRARPILSVGLRLFILVVPAGGSFPVTLALPPHLPPARPAGGRVLGARLAGAAVVVIGVERLGRRSLPLVMLLKLSMLFPDRAPSRFAVARQAGSVRQLKRRLAQLEEDPQGAGESSNAA